MENLIHLALTLAQAIIPPPPPRPRISPFVLALAAVSLTICALVAAVFYLIAIWRFLLPYLGPVGTPLAIAGLATLKAIVILLWLHFAKNRPAPAAAMAQPSPVAAIAAQVAEAEALVKEHKTSALVAALLVGLMAGRKE